MYNSNYCLWFSNHLTTTLKERIYEETFVVSSRGASRRYVSSSSRNYVVRMQNILLSGMNFIISSQCMCTHPTEQTNETHKKLLLYFTCHLGCLYLYICPSKTSFNILKKLSIYVLNSKHLKMIVLHIIRKFVGHWTINFKCLLLLIWLIFNKATRKITN